MTEQTAGWYGDPRGAENTWRWWDGSRWTTWLSDDAAAPSPASPGGPRVRLPLAVLVVVAAVVMSLLVVGAVVWISTPRLSTGPAVDPPAPVTVSTRVDYDPGSRAAAVEQVRMVLPAMPYGCEPEGAKPPIFTSVVMCNAVVHDNYNSAGEDWFATIGIGVLPKDQVAGTLSDTATQLFDTLRVAFFTDQKTTVKNLTRQQRRAGLSVEQHLRQHHLLHRRAVQQL